MIFVVDDDARIRTATAQALRHAGFTVAEFDGGQAAICGLADHHPDLLVTDVLMPGMNGPALVSAMHDRLPGLPILFISGDVGETPMSAFGNAPLLPKPFTATKLIAAVKGLLED